MNVAVVYHFFPHYRGAVLRQLLGGSRHHYVLAADDRSLHESIEPWAVENPERFIKAPCRVGPGGLLWQSGLLGLSRRPDLDAIIFLGNPHYLSTWIAALWARWAGKRVLFWTHGWNRRERGPKAWLRHLFYRIPHGLLLYGHMAKMCGLEKGFPPHRLHVIYNSLDYQNQKRIRESLHPQELAQVRRELFPHPDRPLVVCSARLTPQCRFDLLLEALHRLAGEGRDCNLLLIGDGPERAPLESLARQRDLPVRFYGACYDEERLARLISAAHVTVSPGKVGLTAMQSLAFGTPVITHDNWHEQMPEWEAIVPGSTGDFFRQNDPDDLARVMRLWTRPGPVNPAIRTACQAVLEKFYNPEFQQRAIDRAVSGQPADDLFWLKPDPLPA